jgi:hypothetical protein
MCGSVLLIRGQYRLDHHHMAERDDPDENREERGDHHFQHGVLRTLSRPLDGHGFAEVHDAGANTLRGGGFELASDKT